MKPFALAAAAAAIVLVTATAQAQTAATKRVTSWAGSVQGPYPVGNPSAQPDQRFAFPLPENGARNQTFRLIVRPDVWGRQARLRFSNAFGTKPLTLDGVHVGLQLGGAALVGRSHQPNAVAGKPGGAAAAG